MADVEKYIGESAMKDRPEKKLNLRIKEGAIVTDLLGKGSVTNSKIADDAVTTDKIAEDAVTGDKIKDKTLEGKHFKENTIEGSSLKDNAIESKHIMDNSVPGSKIKDNSLEGIDFEDKTISGEKLMDNSVGGIKLQDGSIGGEKLADKSVQNRNLAAGAVTADKLTGTFTGDKLADNSIPESKLSGTISTSKIADNAVTTAKIGDGAVTTSKIADLNVTGPKIVDRTITRDKIAPHAIDELNGLVQGIADEEDLTAVYANENDLVMKLKDKAYTPAAYSGLGRKYLRKNMVNGVNVLTQEMMSDANTIYIIQYDYELAANITVPANCTLEFDGGSIGGTYTLTGTNTLLKGENIKIKQNIIIAGTWANSTIYTKWFDFISSDDGTTDNVLQFKQLQKMINGTKGCKVEFEKGYYQSSVLKNTPESYVTIDGVTYPKWPTNTYPRDTEIILHILEVPYVDINLNGSTIKIINTVYPRACVLVIDGDGNSYVHDGTVIGMAFNYNYPEYVNHANTITKNYEWQGGLYQHGGFCTIYNMNVHHFNGDGIMVGSGVWYYSAGNIPQFPAKGYIIRDTEVSYCGRNGITLHSSDEGQLKNVHIHHIGSDTASGSIGSDGIMGRSPQAGIDVEFEDGVGRVPIMNWETLYIHDCRAKSFAFASGVSKMNTFSCKDSTFIGFGMPNNLTSETNNNVFSNCYFEKSRLSIDGQLYGHKITYNDCIFSVKTGRLFIGYDTSNLIFNNCSFLDERTENLTDILFDKTGQQGVQYNSCSFNIKGGIGYLGTNSKFYNCVFNISVSANWNATNTEFYDCIFNNKVEDSSSCFCFRTTNYTETSGLKLVNCNLYIGRGNGSQLSEYFFGTHKKVTLKNCVFETSLNIIMYNGSVFDFTNVTASSFYMRPYSSDDTAPYVLTIKDSKFNQAYIFNNDNARYDDSLKIKNSEITAALTAFSNVNIDGGKFNSGVLTSAPKIRAKNSIIEIPSITSANTSSYVLENCYVSGVTETNFKGTATNCTFQVPFPVSGTFASRPKTSPVGFKYFCTDKQTTEGATDGIEIIHKGSDVWVDALGRVVE